MNHDGLMLQFPDETQSRLAADTFSELGYEPQRHSGGRLHIHIRSEDITSALEILQCFGGHIADQAPAEVVALTDEAYGMDVIPIPAHTVNEDWAESYGSAEPEAGVKPEAFPADDAPYDWFDAR